MLGILADRDFEMTDTEDDADIIIINTCCFINDAKEESINTILETADLDKDWSVQGSDCNGLSGTAL